MKWLQFGLLAFAFVAANADFFDYEGYKVYDIEQTSNEEIAFLNRVQQQNPNLDFWKLTKLVGDHAHVMVPPTEQNDFEALLNENGMLYSELISDVQRMVNKEHVENVFRLGPKSITEVYYRHQEINAFLDQLATKYPSTTRVKAVGRSYEGRILKTITISNGDFSPNKKTIFVDGGIHAREWLSPATTLYIISQLVENAAQNQNLLKNLTWVILPVINPDGYEYTFTNQRFWRKTRKPILSCYGTDGNRNFDFHWGEVGASNQPCSDTFRGPNAFSEPETIVVRDLMRNITNAKFYLTLHSYGNYLLYPWGYTSALPSTWRDLDDVAKAGADAMRLATGVKFTVGSSTNVLYAAAGGSDDYALGVAGIPIAITMELQGGGSQGFDPPATSIKRNVEESWIGIKAMALRVDAKYM